MIRVLTISNFICIILSVYHSKAHLKIEGGERMPNPVNDVTFSNQDIIDKLSKYGLEMRRGPYWVIFGKNLSTVPSSCRTLYDEVLSELRFGRDPMRTSEGDVTCRMCFKVFINPRNDFFLSALDKLCDYLSICDVFMAKVAIAQMIASSFEGENTGEKIVLYTTTTRRPKQETLLDVPSSLKWFFANMVTLRRVLADIPADMTSKIRRQSLCVPGLLAKKIGLNMKNNSLIFGRQSCNGFRLEYGIHPERFQGPFFGKTEGQDYLKLLREVYYKQ